MTNKPKTVLVELLGDPKSSSYNLGTKSEPDWRKGGEQIELPPEKAAFFVDTRMAVYVDLKLAAAHVLSQPQEMYLRAGDLEFDQTPPQDNQNKDK